MCVLARDSDIKVMLDWHLAHCRECEVVTMCFDAALMNEVLERREWDRVRKSPAQLVWMPGGDPS